MNLVDLEKCFKKPGGDVHGERGNGSRLGSFTDDARASHEPRRTKAGFDEQDRAVGTDGLECVSLVSCLVKNLTQFSLSGERRGKG